MPLTPSTTPGSPRRQRARRRGALLGLAALAVVGVAIVILVMVAGGGQSSGPPSPPGSGSASGSSPQGPPRLVVRQTAHPLPTPLSGEAAVTTADGILVIGGLDAADVSTTGVTRLDPRTGRMAPAGSLGEPLHDLAAASLGGHVFTFGGGAATTVDNVELLHADGPGELVGHLPASRSDLAAATVGQTAYIVGGYDGTTTVAPILETSDGRRFATVGNLRTPVRYGAVAAFGDAIYVFGGELADGQDTDAVQRIDPGSGRVSLVAHLPKPVSHSSAVRLGDRIYVLGGRIAGRATDQILSFMPGSDRVASAGRLPKPLMNAAAASTGRTAYLLGGLDAAGSPQASVISIAVVPTGT